MSSTKLSEIINKTSGQPTIINENSKFVVVTYWWGRGNFNQNTARPCFAFYEDLLKKFIQYITKLINTAITNKHAKPEQYQIIITAIFNSLKEMNSGKKTKNSKKFASFNEIIRKKALDYINSIYDYCNIENNVPDKDQAALVYLEKLKQLGKTPPDYEFKNAQYLENILKIIINESIIANEANITDLFLINNQVTQLKSKFTNLGNELQKQKTILKSKIQFYTQNETLYKCVIQTDPSQTIEVLTNQLNKLELSYQTQIADIKKDIESVIDQKKTINSKINLKLKDKTIQYTQQSGLNDPKHANKSIFDVLAIELQYLSPIKFETMIENWENTCKQNNCNYLAIEYPEFAQPGGYQLAINAKPLFIKKSLEMCNGRAVLYIDGDMTIRKYPTIFDIDDVDFMARGWWIDPRSSYKMSESIMYDPYLFETSGGTMYFSQSPESKTLIDLWIGESDKKSQAGKADDRILSLVFNTKKLLCNLKIIQLPIEYLWLTLDYDERLLEEVYDWDPTKMSDSIFIDHPECLTSEDTATGAGASSDRTPKYYSFLEELVPVSEKIHEFIMFPNEQMVASFASYFDYMNNITYLNDGNPELEELGLIDPENPANNEQPLYITKFSDQYGNEKYPGETETINEIVQINLKRAANMNLEGLNLISNQNNVEIQNTNNSIDDAKIMSLIIRLLNDGKSVIYNPVNKNGYNQAIYAKLKDKEDTLYKNLCLVFNPSIQSFKFSNFFKPKINVNQAILFRPDTILIKFLSMFISLTDFSDFINNGSYELFSRTRIGYIFVPKTARPAPTQGEMLMQGGEGEDVDANEAYDNYASEYEEGLNNFYGNAKTNTNANESSQRNGGKKNKKTIKKNKRMKRKTSKRG